MRPLPPLIVAFRPAHWIKNTFVFLPLVFGHKLFIFPQNIRTLAVFFVFCCAASGVYLLNDAVDIDKDRLHGTKQGRPLASGKLDVRTAVTAGSALICLSTAAAYAAGFRIGMALTAYAALNVAYSLFIKHVVILDVFCLAAFFVFRIAAGTAAAGVAPSNWIIIMTMLLAMFLGFNKRRQELEGGAHAHEQRGVLCQYDPQFIDRVICVLTSAILAVYTLYAMDARTAAAAGSPHMTYSIPFVYYGIFRYLYLIQTKKLGEDPTLILYSDPAMQVNIAAWLSVCAGVVYFHL